MNVKIDCEHQATQLDKPVLRRSLSYFKWKISIPYHHCEEEAGCPLWNYKSEKYKSFAILLWVRGFLYHDCIWRSCIRN